MHALTALAIAVLTIACSRPASTPPRQPHGKTVIQPAAEIVRDQGVLVLRRKGVACRHETFTLKDHGSDLELVIRQDNTCLGQTSTSHATLVYDPELRPISGHFEFDDASGVAHQTDVTRNDKGHLEQVSREGGKVTGTTTTEAPVDHFDAGYLATLLLFCRQPGGELRLLGASGNTFFMSASRRIEAGGKTLTIREVSGGTHDMVLVCEDLRLLGVLYPPFDESTIREGHEDFVMGLGLHR
jgi:hypothetical protein